MRPITKKQYIFSLLKSRIIYSHPFFFTTELTSTTWYILFSCFYFDKHLLYSTSFEHWANKPPIILQQEVVIFLLFSMLLLYNSFFYTKVYLSSTPSSPSWTFTPPLPLQRQRPNHINEAWNNQSAMLLLFAWYTWQAVVGCRRINIYISCVCCDTHLFACCEHIARQQNGS